MYYYLKSKTDIFATKLEMTAISALCKKLLGQWGFFFLLHYFFFTFIKIKKGLKLTNYREETSANTLVEIHQN